jgi:hypothetical protein
MAKSVLELTLTPEFERRMREQFKKIKVMRVKALIREHGPSADASAGLSRDKLIQVHQPQKKKGS